ncbi:hypothetical protein GJV26_10285 [Massilia dura]|uniref:Uncharacterized protein n=1 Tax=Pseudoduganella dura TaxID=321982 RepID=A0A6I3XEY4_9BURK|nr:hypothetical protein [Pseudoduganella dura]MUI12843.1 hypothetical protein [Pseudoduganella dura]
MGKIVVSEDESMPEAANLPRQGEADLKNALPPHQAQNCRMHFEIDQII